MTDMTLVLTLLPQEGIGKAPAAKAIVMGNQMESAWAAFTWWISYSFNRCDSARIPSFGGNMGKKVKGDVARLCPREQEEDE